jgi:hypothetical protein
LNEKGKSIALPFLFSGARPGNSEYLGQEYQVEQGAEYGGGNESFNHGSSPQ